MAPPSAAKALRESFGDRKLPDISRRITACISCRKLKVKCFMDKSKPPCSRCKAHGISCTVRKSLQMLLENDAMWKEEMEHRVEQLERDLGDSSRTRPCTLPSNAGIQESQSTIGQGSIQIGRLQNQDIHQASQTSSKSSLNLSCNLGAFPASSTINATDIGQVSDSEYRPDLISCRVVNLDAAEEYFKLFQQNLDPCIHNVLEDGDTLAQVRGRSSLLTAAICTVASYCTAAKDYQTCLKLLKSEVSQKIFGKQYTFDDVRALCIGAFWLGEDSSALIGLAVRIASELNLHRCITKMPHTKLECYDRTRLFFLVYLCDHHCSLTHGRPPMTRELKTLKSPRAFLQSQYSTPADLDLICQVELWSINRTVFETFGADVESSVPGDKAAQLEYLGKVYEHWREYWSGVLAVRNDLDAFFSRALDLYYHSSRLCLFSHVFRGQGQHPLVQGAPADAPDSFAHQVLLSALLAIRCAADPGGASPWLEALPVYCGTMIAFASVCLVRLGLQEQAVLATDTVEEVQASLIQLVEALRTNKIVERPSNPLSSIATSLETITRKRLSAQQESTIESHNGISSGLQFDMDFLANDSLDFSFFENTNAWMPLFGDWDSPDH